MKSKNQYHSDMELSAEFDLPFDLKRQGTHLYYSEKVKNNKITGNDINDEIMRKTKKTEEK